MKIELLSSTKNQDINISDNAFSKDFNESLVHQAVVSFMAGSRQGTSKQKTRSEVRGGGKKPYRQKGTGRARAGTIRSPLWRGGGVTFAATPRDYSKKINKKMYRAAIRSIFSELLRQGRLVAIEQPVLEKPKTKEIANFLKEFSLSKVLIITDELDVNLYLSSRNIPNVDIITVREINPVNLLKAQKVAVTAEAFKKIEEWIDA
ncbi:50S ribosomal protein L4 [Gammaproteobacteria bacterium]|jgi:large subunit ribosomal protein L4|nr:50S ribosomal protein L4 [Gammaproteobacteria bacterium]MDC0392496.1 50S ribosomal protein L4 [Gammaproteobacteria bacterium]MDC0406208.1 50S ribosomal protein L4 [Gammaproteobacteria bacterium]MDC0536117.1 50S ribosomal protein L4 [Gammaproteobacteria bacterium]MDC1149364.1 50S ribosomal protein L4 [Gammaproteobacteria bacterium]|tara:strand:- start:1405 stop:2019 length:615 start_codon:yes stop_codon:yes gene_type:complete